MNKKDSKNNREKRKTESRQSDFSSLGLDPPKIYRESQNENNRREKLELTRGERRTKQSKKRKKRNKLRKILIWTVVIISFFAVGVVLSLTMFFDISAVVASGSKIYSKDEIKTACSIEVGENLFLADTKKAEAMIEANLPYVYEAEITRELPGTINIKVTDASPVYSIKKTDKTYILLDDNFKVLETDAKKAKGVFVNKADIKSADSGKPIVFNDNDIGNCLKSLAKTIKDNNFTVITSIYSNSITDNYVVYDNRISFKLGNCDNLEDKIYKGLAACEKLNESNPNARGTMTVSGGKSIYFTEK